MLNFFQKMLDKVRMRVYNSMVSKAELRSHLKRLSKKVNTVNYSYAVYCMSAEIFLHSYFYSEILLVNLRRCLIISNKNDTQINEAINDKEVRLIGEDGSQLGIVSGKEAQRVAYEKDLDLVKIAPMAKPPVCKIMDYGKYCFEQAKKEKEARKNQKIVEVKEVRMSSTIDTHDFETKANQARKFLKSGDKLKVSVRFRKRAVAHPQLGEELLERFKEAVSEFGTVDKKPKMEGRSLVMFVNPKASK